MKRSPCVLWFFFLSFSPSAVDYLRRLRPTARRLNRIELHGGFNDNDSGDEISQFTRYVQRINWTPSPINHTTSTPTPPGTPISIASATPPRTSISTEPSTPSTFRGWGVLETAEANGMRLRLRRLNELQSAAAIDIPTYQSTPTRDWVTIRRRYAPYVVDNPNPVNQEPLDYEPLDVNTVYEPLNFHGSMNSIDQPHDDSMNSLQIDTDAISEETEDLELSFNFDLDPTAIEPLPQPICAICYDELHRYETCHIQCGHIVHRHCLGELVQTHNGRHCPVCNGRIRNIKRVYFSYSM